MLQLKLPQFRERSSRYTRARGALRQVEDSDGEVGADSLEALLRRVSEVSTGEIEKLVDEFHGLRKKLQTDLSRIQRDIAQYRELSQAVMQLAASLSDGMKELPAARGSFDRRTSWPEELERFGLVPPVSFTGAAGRGHTAAIRRQPQSAHPRLAV
jgi:hypothetical protein